MVWASNTKRRRYYALQKERNNRQALRARRQVQTVAPAYFINAGGSGLADRPTNADADMPTAETGSHFSEISEPETTSTPAIWKVVHLDFNSSMTGSNSDQEQEQSDAEEEEIQFSVGLEGKLLGYMNHHRLTRVQMVALLDIINSFEGQIITRLPKRPASLVDSTKLTARTKRQHKFDNRFYLQTDSYIYIGIARALQYLFLEHKSDFKNAETIDLCFNTDGLPISSEYLYNIFKVP